MPETVDVIVLGIGPGGEVAASRLLGAGRRVAAAPRPPPRRRLFTVERDRL